MTAPDQILILPGGGRTWTTAEDPFVQIPEQAVSPVAYLRADTVVPLKGDQGAAVAHLKALLGRLGELLPSEGSDSLSLQADAAKAFLRSIGDAAEFGQQAPMQASGPIVTDEEVDLLLQRGVVLAHGLETQEQSRGHTREQVSAIVGRALASAARQSSRSLEPVAEFLNKAAQWSQAYPESLFRTPTLEQVDQVCKSMGLPLQNIAAMVLREFTGQWSQEARASLDVLTRLETNVERLPSSSSAPLTTALKAALAPFADAFEKHGKFIYEGLGDGDELIEINDQNEVVPSGTRMGDFRRAWETLGGDRE